MNDINFSFSSISFLKKVKNKIKISGSKYSCKTGQQIIDNKIKNENMKILLYLKLQTTNIKRQDIINIKERKIF